MFINNGGATWTDNSGWLGSGDHCTWAGVLCSLSSSVTALSMSSNQMTGSFPDDLGSLGSLQTLAASGNSLTGTIPNDMCSRPMSITGDAINCPNSFDGATGVYLAGCCDNVLVDVDIYLAEFAEAVLGSSNCGSLGGTESDVCNYMSNKANHAVFNSGYPTSFNGDLWDWLKVSEHETFQLSTSQRSYSHCLI